MIHIAPSLLSADFRNLENEIKSVKDSGADFLHLDIMDGHFVPNITFGPFIVDFCRKTTDLTLDVHLMIEQPEKYIGDFVKAGADIISVHVEACPHLHRQLQFIRSFGIKSGVAVNPATEIDFLDYVIDDLDMILFMTVNPGFSGQKFIPSVLKKIELFNNRYRASLKDDFIVQVDGGVNDKTCKLLTDSGVNCLVSGNYFFKHPDRKEAVKVLKGEIL
ncbi:MAG: ribulose-phosphate 3-epimerase [Candidatus Delongbacteria bacterium]|nr:ribulose-phosphate 3-epimerase [Candidatus Delongbacteria bacterium]MCG2760304.1 ribulose-phosphate 3-epimerase [Candidatus Delongbacteria bacterium]